MLMTFIRPVFKDKKFQFIIEVDFQLDAFKEYINITENIIEKEVIEKINKYKNFLDDASEEEIKYLYDFQEDQIKNNIQDLYYNSIFILIYSFLEKKMYQLCKIAEINNKIKIDKEDNGISKYYKILTKKLKIKQSSKEWSSIKKYNRLRNLLVHNQEQIVKKSKKNKVLFSIKNLKTTYLDNGNFIEFKIINKQLLLDSLSDINIFLKNIYYDNNSIQ